MKNSKSEASPRILPKGPPTLRVRGECFAPWKFETIHKRTTSRDCKLLLRFDSSKETVYCQASDLSHQQWKLPAKCLVLPEGPATIRSWRRVLRTIEFHAGAGKNCQRHCISELRLPLEPEFSISQGILWDRFSQYVQAVLIAISSHTLGIWIFRWRPNITSSPFFVPLSNSFLTAPFSWQVSRNMSKGRFLPEGPVTHRSCRRVLRTTFWSIVEAKHDYTCRSAHRI